MRISFFDEAWEGYLYWQATDKAMLKKVNELIKDILRQPYDGIGKPEALRQNLSGWWSRRITQEHRIVYRLQGEEVQILSVRYHYED
ncbi:MAG: Txe/YoeB family addiction module toxin [Meiothermus sp.]|nr:Txe/YoeB family addiction module toxin [Meiothermus sp.]